MPRYAKPRANGWIEDDGYDDEPFRPSLEVDDHDVVDTGLIWTTGEPIMRVPNPIGFGRDEEW